MAGDPYSNPYSEHQLKRWTRPDAHRFIRPDWRRFVAPGSELARLYEAIERKYSPDQPRVPAGSADGGQWTGGPGASADGVGASGTLSLSARTKQPAVSSSAEIDKIVAQARRVASSGESRRNFCIKLCTPLLERFQPAGSDRN